jgi:hypothetical protein
VDQTKETKANLEAKLAQAHRLSAAITDPQTADRLKSFIADLENRLRDLGD